MKVYKFLNSNNSSACGVVWKMGENVETSGKGELFSPGFTYWYVNPYTAVLLNPLYGDYDLKSSNFYEGEGNIKKTDGFVVGCDIARIVNKIEIPQISMKRMIAIIFLCELEKKQNEKLIYECMNAFISNYKPSTYEDIAIKISAANSLKSMYNFCPDFESLQFMNKKINEIVERAFKIN